LEPVPMHPELPPDLMVERELLWLVLKVTQLTVSFLAN
jgi:hypothetical protein